MSDNDTNTSGTVVPFRRPDDVDGEIVESSGTDLAVTEPRQTWGTRVMRSTGKALAGPSDHTRARLAESTVEFTHTAGRTTRRGLSRARRFGHRHGAIIAKGFEAARQRRRADRGHSDLKAAITLAREKGDTAQVEALTKQLNEGRTSAVAAAKMRADLAWSLTRRAALVVAVVFAASLLTGGVNGFGHWLGEWNANDALGVWRAVFGTIYQVMAVMFTLWWAGLLAAGGVWLGRRWKDGVRLGEQVLPAHLRKQGTRTRQVELTEGALTQALANIGNTQLKGYIKEGWPNRETDNAWVQPPIGSRKGWSVQIRLPLGVDVAAVKKAHPLLAHNLGCRGPELFLDPSEEDPTVLDLFRLSPGVLREPVDPYPLLVDGIADFWTGFPVGVTPRGDPVVTTVLERNFVFSGTMGSGKSTMILDLLYGAILDPLVDIDVFVFATNNDYDLLRPCLKTFSDGGGSDNVQACLDHIEDLYADLETRGRLLQRYGVNSVAEGGRDLVASEPRLRPRIVVIDECQAFFRQDTPEERRRVVNLLVNFYSAARKYGISLVFATPLPSDQSLPRDLVAVTSNKACGAIGDKTRNNVVLGDKAHENGVSALDLKPKTDKALNDCGTLITIGFMDNPGAVRSYYLTKEEQKTLVERALQLRGGTATAGAEAAVVERDTLADILTVTTEVTPRDGERQPRVAAIVAALRNNWSYYQDWKSEHVLTVLAESGYKVPTTDRKFLVDPAKVAEALHRRAAEEDDPTE
ncbi:ATP-binding protein [Amycolatopsis minnesotensis]|uniref:S-DNA-T family DNA segregation ATPase FtsK/SpoIIIE n=1 Tax=Amycolatopsis minnesotensis TaxID=337894 RepID=A0ABP5DXV6_9PSEU